METIRPTTPFGRRPLSLGMVAAQAAAKACPDDAAAQKWHVFRNITEAKAELRLSDRALAVLGALLSFHPETALIPGPDLVVFPSNRELALRAHGPAPATLRRALDNSSRPVSSSVETVQTASATPGAGTADRSNKRSGSILLH